jgi:hypothetical protein
MPTANVSIRSACRIAISTLVLVQTSAARAAPAEIQAAVEYCGNAASRLNLSEDGTILCFDGAILKEAPVDVIAKLNDRGFFVVRSPGGFLEVAIKIADILMEKDATVVIRDYCLSACANYLLVATRRTYVLKNTLVAWHRPTDLGCGNLSDFEAALGGQTFCKYEKDFFQKRGIASRHIFSPRTTYTRMMLNSLAQTQGHRSEFFWMWNPKNYGDYFKDRIVYEGYPRSQGEVNAIIRRLHVMHPDQIIYDPEL